MAEANHLSLTDFGLIASRSPTVVRAVVGSGVSVCLFARNGSVGGIVHYAQAQIPGRTTQDDALRYGEFAISALVCELKKIVGARLDIVAKIVGGACDSSTAEDSRIGSENVHVARQMLADFKIPVIGESIGGSAKREILFHIPSGRLQVATLGKNAGRRRVLVVDDSKTIRDLLKKILSDDPELTIVGFASNPLEAEEMLAETRPDVITLDIHMPRMTGVEWLARLLPKRPIPVVMISSLQLQEGNEVFRALELGAVDYIQKPNLHELVSVGPVIREKVKSASFAKVIRLNRSHKEPTLTVSDIDGQKILAIGASTGGTEAIKSVLQNLPPNIPPTVIVQHIPAAFSKAFANRLNEICPFDVKEAEDGDLLRPGRVLIAPGGKQMKIQKTTRGICIRLTDDPPMSRHKPSVDYLFHSVAEVMGDHCVGVILTGMGSDGAEGLLQMRKKGARTLGQNEESCVVYGMPRVAFEMGGVEKVVDLRNVGKEILRLFAVRKAS